MISKILIVDDDSTVRGQLAEWLSDAGFECRAATEPAEALALARSNPPDAAIVAAGLPDGEAIWLARRLKRHSTEVGVILLTGAPSFSTGVTAMRMGISDYLLKPFTREEVLESVTRALTWRSALLRDRAMTDAVVGAVSADRDRLQGMVADTSGSAEVAIQALLAVLNSQMPETHAHVRRVAAIAVRIATEMRLSDRQMVLDVERSALLHDIGKVTIPDAVLSKTGPLTDDEVEIVRSHVMIGFDILSVLPSLRNVAHVVVATHERFDGCGYPAGLAGYEIPLGARIIAVADAYDALTVGRVYRDPISRDDALAELVRSAGTHFDPDVVRAWLRADEGRLCS